MNQKKAKSLRSQCSNRKSYRRMKKLLSAQAKTNASQNPTPINERKHKEKPLIDSTWPHTRDQNRQSRPVIVLRPVRALMKKNTKTPWNIPEAVGCLPKHVLDKLSA